MRGLFIIIAVVVWMLMSLAGYASGATYGDDGEMTLYQDHDTVIVAAQGMSDGSNTTLLHGQDLDEIELSIIIELFDPLDLDTFYDEWYANLSISGPSGYTYDDLMVVKDVKSFHNTTHSDFIFRFHGIGLNLQPGNYIVTVTLALHAHYVLGTGYKYSSAPEHTILIEVVSPGGEIVTYGEMLKMTLGGIGGLMLILGPAFIWFNTKSDSTVVAMSMGMVMMLIGFVFFYVFMLGG